MSSGNSHDERSAASTRKCPDPDCQQGYPCHEGQGCVRLAEANRQESDDRLLNWQQEYQSRGIRSGWRGPVFIARSPGWFGIRWRKRSYYVLRDSLRHKPLFSEREGIRPFRLLVQVGRWQFGVKP